MGYPHFFVLGFGAVLCPDLLMMEPRGIALWAASVKQYRLDRLGIFSQITISAEHKLKLYHRPFVFPLELQVACLSEYEANWIKELWNCRYLCDYDLSYSTQVFIVSNMDQFTIKPYALCSTLQYEIR